MFAFFFHLKYFIACNKSFIQTNVNLSSSSDAIFAFCKLIENDFHYQRASMNIIADSEYFEKLECNLDTKVAFTLLNFEFFTQENSTVEASMFNAIFYKTLHDVHKIFTQKNSHQFRLDGFYILISALDCSEKESTHIFTILWKIKMFNVNIICKHSSHIVLETFLPYQKVKSCGSTHPLIINTFSNQSWQSGIFFPKKFTNLHKCPIKVASFLYPPITERETLPNGSYRYFGSEMELVQSLSDAINFQIDHHYSHATGLAGFLYENGTATGYDKIFY
jgi:hypothetical protein